jgi:hypothetical protein
VDWEEDPKAVQQLNSLRLVQRLQIMLRRRDEKVTSPEQLLPDLRHLQLLFIGRGDDQDSEE